MTDYYVYAHKTISPRDKGEIFYIGKGRAKRAWSKGQRNPHWKAIVAKYGYTVEILASGVSEEVAFELERAFILMCGREVLCNLTAGGDGISGHRHSDEARRKISEAGMGRQRSPESIAKAADGIRGMKHSDESRANMSSAHKGQTAWNKGKTFSDESRLKMSSAHKGKKLPESTRANMRKNRVGMKGKQHSEETRAKISATKKNKALGRTV